jgi:solute carrier family 35 protein F1/2
MHDCSNRTKDRAVTIEVLSLAIIFAQATVFNLSLLTADVYTLIYGVCVFELTFKWPYLISFFATLVGVFLYTTAPEQPPRVTKPPKTP